MAGYSVCETVGVTPVHKKHQTARQSAGHLDLSVVYYKTAWKTHELESHFNLSTEQSVCECQMVSTTLKCKTVMVSF